ncbi:MAG: hypothetical protein PHW62_03465, partial [Candidatus Ratteibacteria bacterium]|nr:hypothetical protein [Candidatus Ratteibacteria bacterium]
CSSDLTKDTIPALLRPQEVVMPLEKLPSLIPKITMPTPAYAGVTVNNYFYGDIKTKADEEELFPMLEKFIKNQIRGS